MAFQCIEEINEKRGKHIQELCNEKLGKIIKPTTKKTVTSSNFNRELDRKCYFGGVLKL
jgi:hypothetical protein